MRYIFLIRMHHWVKNFFLFIPLFFSGKLMDAGLVSILVEGFFSFSLVASSIYIFNDIKDIESDRIHPVKQNRPMASGKVSPGVGVGVMLCCAVAGLGWAYMLMQEFFLLILLYMVINVSYSFGLKNITLVDVFLVASGFLIRTIAGGVLVRVYASQWLIIMVFLLALLLTFSKRRDDLIRAKKGTAVRRKSCREYSLDFINITLSLIAGVIMVSYLMYTFSGDVQDRIGENYLYITSLFVFAGILRYLQITLVNNDSGSPTRIFLTDRILQSALVGWSVTFFITLYL